MLLYILEESRHRERSLRHLLLASETLTDNRWFTLYLFHSLSFRWLLEQFSLGLCKTYRKLMRLFHSRSAVFLCRRKCFHCCSVISFNFHALFSLCLSFPFAFKSLCLFIVQCIYYKHQSSTMALATLFHSHFLWWFFLYFLICISLILNYVTY